MDFSALQPLFDWIEQHPTAAGVMIFLIALSESLAVVGMFIPGVALMFGIGALIATGIIDFWAACAWAIAGAIVGDGLSYWLGRHYQDRLRNMWPLRRYPDMIDKGEAFFTRHGGKSVLFGRFFGPIRAIVPAVAGMMGMRSSTFFAANIASALLWAPAYLLPGMVFGASLTIAAEVGARLVALIISVLLVLWFSGWGIHRSYRYLTPHADDFRQRLLDWGRNHPHLGPLSNALVDPQQPAARSLALIALILIIIASTLMWLAQLISLGPPLARLDSSSYHLLQQLRTPWADQWITGFTLLGSPLVSSAVFAAVLLWLAWQRRWLTSLYWCASAAFAMICSLWLKHAFQAPRPVAELDAMIGFSFPSAHALVTTCIYGFLAVLIARELSPRWRWLAYSISGIWILAMGFSRLYLGVHWLSDVLAALILGALWVLVLGIASRAHLSKALAIRGLLLAPLAALLTVGSWHIHQTYGEHLALYNHQSHISVMQRDDWLASGWKTLPPYRIDTRGILKQPLNLQWAGSIDELRQSLLKAGWQVPQALTPASAMLWLQKQPTLSDLPLLPQAHDGFAPELSLMHPELELMLRLWPSQTQLEPEATPLWLGSVGELTAYESPYFTLPRMGGDFNLALSQLDITALSSILQPAAAIASNHQRLLIWSADKPIVQLQNSHSAPMD